MQRFNHLGKDGKTTTNCHGDIISENLSSDDNGKTTAKCVGDIASKKQSSDDDKAMKDMTRKEASPSEIVKEIATTTSNKLVHETEGKNSTYVNEVGDDYSSDKENDCMEDKENDEDWNPDNIIERPIVTVPVTSKRGRKPLGELLTLPPEENEISEYEKIQKKRKAEQRAMLDAMKTASMSLTKAIIPKPVRRQIAKVRHTNFGPTRKEPPILRSKRTRQNSHGSSEQNSEMGDSDSFVYLPAKRKYEFYSDDEEDEYKPKVNKCNWLYIHLIFLINISAW